MNRERYVIYHNEKPVSKINESLLKFKKVSQESEEKIIELHEVRLEIYDIINLTDDKNILRVCVKLIEEIDYRLQELWGFGRNKDYHRFWEIPKCECPRMENEDRLGTKYRVYSLSCILHGNLDS